MEKRVFFCVFFGGSRFVGGATDMANFFFVVVHRLFLAGQEFVLTPLKFEGGQDSLFVRNFAGGRGNVRGRENRVEWQPKEKRGEAWK